MERYPSTNKNPSYVWAFGAQQTLLAPKEPLREKVKMEETLGRSLFHASTHMPVIDIEMELYLHSKVPFCFLTRTWSRQQMDSRTSQCFWELTLQNPNCPPSVHQRDILSSKTQKPKNPSIIAFQPTNRHTYVPSNHFSPSQTQPMYPPLY